MKPVSKSQFILSLQCEKAFWLYRHQKDLLKHTKAQEKIMQSGTDFGVLMQGLFPGGVDVSQVAENFGHRISLTGQILSEANRPIYEATLSLKVGGVPLLCMVDILVPAEDGWYIYEVKSSTSVKDTHIADAGFQQYVAEKMGLEILSVNIVHVNNQYVRQGALDIQELGRVVDITQEMADAHLDFDGQLEELVGVDSNGLPEKLIGPHCFSPYPCGFIEHCWKDVPKENSVFDFFPATKAFELYNQGYFTLDEVPTDYDLKGKSQKRLASFKSGEEIFDRAEVKAFLGLLQYPIAYMDFETFGTTVPLFDNSRPYEQLCFQYSVHIHEGPDLALEHKEFLADAVLGDPRRAFIENLIRDVPKTGSVVVYNAAFEKGRLSDLAALFPEYEAAIQGIINRMVDLLKPFSSLHVYNTQMKGSASIKAVLPALVPEMSYDDMEIGDGGAAMDVFENMVLGNYSLDETDKLRASLLEYCRQDTLAMVRIVEVLREMLI